MSRMETARKQKTKNDDKEDRNVDKSGDAAEFKCGSCMKIVLEQENGVLCEICGGWYHCRCQSISEQLYKVLNQYSSELHWFCKGCQAGADKLLALFTRMQAKVDRMEEEISRVHSELRHEIASSVQDLRTDIQKLSKRCDDYESKAQEYRQELESKVADKIEGETKASWSEIVAKEVETRFSTVTAEVTSLHKETCNMWQDKKEHDEIERRKTSLIIHGVKEPAAAEAQAAKKEDEDNFMELLDDLGCSDVSVDLMTRLGRRPSGDDDKPRPVKLVVASENQKDKILRRSKNLRNLNNGKYSDVFAHQDLTPNQRERRRQLLQELKTRKDLGETDLVLRNWKIVKRWEFPDAY